MAEEQIWVVYTVADGILGIVPEKDAEIESEAIQNWSEEYCEAKLINKSELPEGYEHMLKEKQKNATDRRFKR